MTLDDLVRDRTADWIRQPPASDAVVERLAAAVPGLPADYLAFLRLSNGGDGVLGIAPGWFALWPAEDVADTNTDYQVPEYLPGFVAFGGTGGGEMLAFGTTRGRAGRVYAVPYVPMEAAGAREIARDFTTLARAFGRGAPPA